MCKIFETEFQRGNYCIEYSSNLNGCDVSVVMVEGGWNRIRFNTSAKIRLGFLMEPKAIWCYDSSFLNQFTDIVSSYEIQNCSSRFHHRHQCNNLFIGYDLKNRKQNIEIIKETFLSNEKTKLISAICSNKCYTPMHRQRQDFLNKLKKDIPELDLFGTITGNTLTYKDTALSKYKYTIAIENSIFKDYWTEKIGDPIFSLTTPIYCGCPNISDYFDNICCIDIQNYKESLNRIKEVIYSPQDTNTTMRNRKKLLTKWNLHNTIFEILENVA